MTKLLKEVEVFTEILSMIPGHSLNDQEKQVILDELKLSLKPMQPYLQMLDEQKYGGQSYQQVPNVSISASSSTSMVLMIFRFFIQSGEYQFFIKRLKNVSVTKLSLLKVHHDTPYKGGQQQFSNQGTQQQQFNNQGAQQQLSTVSQYEKFSHQQHQPAQSSYLNPKEFKQSQMNETTRSPVHIGTSTNIKNYQMLMGKMKMSRSSSKNTPVKQDGRWYTRQSSNNNFDYSYSKHDTSDNKSKSRGYSSKKSMTQNHTNN